MNNETDASDLVIPEYLNITLMLDFTDAPIGRMSIKVTNVLSSTFRVTSSAHESTRVSPTNNGVEPCYPSMAMGVFVRQSIMSTNLIH